MSNVGHVEAMRLICELSKVHMLERIRRIFQIVSTAAVLISTAAQAEVMSVRAERPDLGKVFQRISSWNIVLDGVIDSGAPARVAEALKMASSDGADVYINSPGGNLLAGMQIGRLIRRAGANTHIGTLVADPSRSIGGKQSVKYLPGNCLSACGLAFLGGVYRYGIKEGKYGVHRFSSSSEPKSSDMDAAQIISAAVGTYIREMDVDPGLFDLMVQEGKDDIRILSDAEMTGLNVTNNGWKKPKWSIEAVEGGQYLRGMQESVYGQGKAIFFCGDGQIFFRSYYQTGTEDAKSIASGGWYHSLFVDGKTIVLPKPIEANASGMEIATLFLLTSNQTMAIASSSSMGHAMQISRDAPTYVGYRIHIPISESQKVGAFLRNCLKH